MVSETQQGKQSVDGSAGSRRAALAGKGGDSQTVRRTSQYKDVFRKIEGEHYCSVPLVRGRIRGDDKPTAKKMKAVPSPAIARISSGKLSTVASLAASNPDIGSLKVDAFDGLDALGRMRLALDTFGDGFALTTSFGIQAAVSLHLVSQLDRKVPVIWVDTGYLPAETYRYAQKLIGLLGLEVYVAQSDISPARMEALYGRLWETGSVEDLETYHRIRKVEPLDRVFRELGVTCWASGAREAQTQHRKAMLPLDKVRGRWALRPLLDWSDSDVQEYMQEHDLPPHPLVAKGYSTVGDWHSSGPDTENASGRATRFGGLKQECGIHTSGQRKS
jgi:phosphoadenosine phosphosulfate reductase